MGAGMRRRGRVRGVWGLAVCVAALTFAACGSSGTSGIAFPQDQNDVQPAIHGTIYAPDVDGDGTGVYAARPWPRWAESLALIPRAYALQHVAPIDSDETVTLVQLDSTEAEHGQTDTAAFKADTRTMAGGQFEIRHALAETPEEVCRLMLVVRSGEEQTRAFVLSRSVNPPGTSDNLDAVSEALVRIVLQRLTQPPAVQLCDFDAKGLSNIYNAAWEAAYSVSGTSVAQINDKAFAAVAASQKVHQAIVGATGIPFGTP
jgi:hypothetical protein